MWQLTLILITVCIATIFWYLTVLLERIQSNIKLRKSKKRKKGSFNLYFIDDEIPNDVCMTSLSNAISFYRMCVSCVSVCCMCLCMYAVPLYYLFNFFLLHVRYDMRYECMRSSENSVYGTENDRIAA